ncbi:helix-turn-helix domain-containing protein [Clostridium tertium]|uniref:helix-turn-helix domain-containing protein n=1 Tax=Clostridium tertium TaxID=1559 RepID=UPI0024B399AA|nr:helix-turn-helix domain-containing protein [Clostridium tertium]MDI9215926.1 helix-turn-helix domain-containing protein [Clostridium tertium]
MDINKIIKKILIDEDMTQGELASKIETTQQNLSKKFKNDSFYVKDLVKIAESLGYELKIEFIKEIKKASK